MRIIGMIFANIALILLVFIMFKPIIRLLSKKFKILKKLNLFMIRSHKTISIIFIICVLFHFIFSTIFAQKLMIIGFICFILIILCIAPYFFRKKLKKKFLIIHRIISFILLGFVIFHLVEVGGIKIFKEIKSDNNITEIVIPENTLFNGEYTLKDGEYFGRANGYKGETELCVTVSNGVVTNIEIVSTGDSKAYITKVENAYKVYIINNQTDSLEIVAGATFSSNGYKNAFIQAINQAIVK